MPSRSAAGFTILEALVAVAIVTTGVLGLVSLARQVTDSVARSRRHLAAALLADGYVAERLGQPIAGTATDCLERDVGGCMTLLDSQGRPTTGAASFVRRWRVSAVPGAGATAWSLTVCVVPNEQRHGRAARAGACVARLLTAVTP